ncbi:MAG: hypothetical protein AABW67_02890 [Nanoarchaeota archaeon]
MKTKSKKNLVGAWAFLIGIVLALVIGLFSNYFVAMTQEIILGTLLFLGLAVGFFNITNKESSKFLLVSIALVIASYIGYSVMAIIPQISNILNALLVLLIPAIIIVALRSLFEIAKN